MRDDQEPKYLFYEGFAKSAELYGQELITLHEDAEAQIRETGSIVLMEGPFDVAKAVEAGLWNVVGSFGATLSEAQAGKLARWSARFDGARIRIVYDRDDAGQTGAAKAATLLQGLNVNTEIFDWTAPVGRSAAGPVHIPDTIRDPGDMSVAQLRWLRARGRL